MSSRIRTIHSRNQARKDAARAQHLRAFGHRSLGFLDADEAEAVHIAMAGIRNVPMGSELLAAGSMLNIPFLLLDGWAVRQQVLTDGRRQIFSFILPGEAIGLSALQDMRAPSAIVALTDVSLLPLQVLGDAMLAHVGELFDWGQDMLKEEEVAMHDQVMRLGIQTAHERVAHQLLEFYYRLHHVGLTEDHAFSLPFTQDVLSDALGLSTVHVNRTLQRLRRDGLIESQGHTMHLLDMPALFGLSHYRPWQRLRPTALAAA